MLLLGSRDQRASSSLHKAIVAPLPASGLSLALGLAHKLCPLRGIGLGGYDG